MANLWTHCPVTGKRSSGLNSARTPTLRGSHDAPAVARLEHADRRDPDPGPVASVGWGMIVCRMSPPAPGPQVGRVGWLVRPSTWRQVVPPSSLRKSPAGSTPGEDAAVGRRRQAPDRLDRLGVVAVGHARRGMGPGRAAVLGSPHRRPVPGVPGGDQDRPAPGLDDQVVDRPALAQRATDRPVARACRRSRG